MGQSTGRTERPTAVRHPLDPLSADEFRRAASTLREVKGFDERWRFAAIELKEPSKEVLASGSKIPREALLICWNRDDGKAYKAVVSLDENRVVSWEHRPDEQPNVTVDEYHECDVTLRRNPKVVEALAARGYEPYDDPDGTIRLCNCPFDRIAAQHRQLVCGANHAMLQALTDQVDSDPPTVRAVLDPQPGRCCVTLTRDS